MSQQHPGQYADPSRAYPPSAGPGPRKAGLFDIRFTRFLSLSLISLWYVVALVLIAIAALVGVVFGFVSMAGDRGVLLGLLIVLGSLVGAVVAMVLTRLSLEGVAVLFRIADNTSVLAEHSRRG